MTVLPSGSKPILAPSHITVVGGGRWARVILDVLCEFLPAGVPLEVHTRAQTALTEWQAGHPRRKRIAFAASFPAAPGGAVIVANAARDHASVAAAALRARNFVLLEKPLAPDYDAARSLVELSTIEGDRLAAAQVMLFTGYTDNFAAEVARVAPLESVECIWTDPVAEIRHGERKSYDPGVSVFCDWLPHVVPLLEKFLSARLDAARLTAWRAGGAGVDLSLEGAGVSCVVRFARQSDRRRRIFRVRGAGGTVELDSSREPGTIVVDGTSLDADPGWSTRPGPLAQLLATFLAWSAGALRDPRLAPDAGLRACRLVDQIEASYRPSVEKWLGARLAAGTPVDAALHYALRELLHRQQRWPAAEIAAELAAIARSGCPWSEALTGHSAAAQFLRAFVSENLHG